MGVNIVIFRIKELKAIHRQQDLPRTRPIVFDIRVNGPWFQVKGKTCTTTVLIQVIFYSLICCVGAAAWISWVPPGPAIGSTCMPPIPERFCTGIAPLRLARPTPGTFSPDSQHKFAALELLKRDTGKSNQTAECFRLRPAHSGLKSVSPLGCSDYRYETRTGPLLQAPNLGFVIRITKSKKFVIQGFICITKL